MVIREFTGDKFPLGKLLMTRGVADKCVADSNFNKFALGCLGRHSRGDWGNLCDEDSKENELSLEKGFRLLSAYELEGLPKIWITTEADRSATTILFPEEY